jgi:hypothetical protein
MIIFIDTNIQADMKASSGVDSLNDDHQAAAYNALSSGYGFGSFCYICAFVFALVASIYYSPMLCGSPNEKRMLKDPTQIDTGYNEYHEQGGGYKGP